MKKLHIIDWPANVLKGTIWTGLVTLVLLYLLFVLIPFYGSGVYRMSDYQIYTSHVDLSWYPVFGEWSNIYEWIMATAVLWTCVVPFLLLTTSLELLGDWPMFSNFGKVLRFSILIPALLMFVSLCSSARILGIWLLD